jgi:hypothetical protein
MLQRHLGELPEPVVLPSFPDGVFWCGECRVGECPDGDRDQARKPFRLPVNGGAANRAEMEIESIAVVGRAAELRRAPADGSDLLARKPCLCAEHAPRPPLAFEAVAHRYPDRLTFTCEAELATIACSGTNCHCLSECLALVRC